MLPLFKYQKQVYRLAEARPPVEEGLADHAPVWHTVTFILAALQSVQMRINVQRDFWLIAITASATTQTAAGGFRAQLYDTIKKVRFADRGQLMVNIAGSSSGPFFLRDPYQFDQPDSQVLVNLTNMENAQNTVQLALYGQVLRFNQ